MKIAVYTLTRDRLDYTKHNFQALREKAGCEFDHFVVDNGSQDGTKEWLLEQGQRMFRTLILNDENKGISVASNQALDLIKSCGDYDLIIKMDNDCEVEYDGILDRIAKVYRNMPPFRKLMLSPKVNGIVNQPPRYSETMVDDCKIGIVGMVGGLFHILPGEIYQEFRYAEALPLAWGQDENVCTWFRQMGGECGYLEDITVAHYETTDGQAKRYPEYFKRKWKEEGR